MKQAQSTCLAQLDRHHPPWPNTVSAAELSADFMYSAPYVFDIIPVARRGHLRAFFVESSYRLLRFAAFHCITARPRWRTVQPLALTQIIINKSSFGLCFVFVCFGPSYLIPDEAAPVLSFWSSHATVPHTAFHSHLDAMGDQVL